MIQGPRKGAKQDTCWHYVVHLILDIQGNRAFKCVNINEVSIYSQSPSLTSFLEIDVSLKPGMVRGQGRKARKGTGERNSDNREREIVI